MTILAYAERNIIKFKVVESKIGRNIIKFKVVESKIERNIIKFKVVESKFGNVGPQSNT
jgi:hypothetical protein